MQDAVAIAIAVAMLTACGTVGTYVPAARGTDTGNIRVDALTSVDTSSRIIPAQVAVPAQPCQQCRQANCPHARPAGTEMRWVTDASRGIEINTHRQSLVSGARDVGIGVGAAAGVGSQGPERELGGRAARAGSTRRAHCWPGRPACG